MVLPMKLGQNQVWKQGQEYIRIVELERLTVRYKIVLNLLTGEGTHQNATKKDFCRWIKGATLLTQSEVREIWKQSPSSFDLHVDAGQLDAGQLDAGPPTDEI